MNAILIATLTTLCLFTPEAKDNERNLVYALYKNGEFYYEAMNAAVLYPGPERAAGEKLCYSFEDDPTGEWHAVTWSQNTETWLEIYVSEPSVKLVIEQEVLLHVTSPDGIVVPMPEE